MPRYKVEMSRTCYYIETATVEVDAIDERHAKQVACNEDVDWDSGDSDSDGIEYDVEEIEPEEDEEETVNVTEDEDE